MTDDHSRNGPDYHDGLLRAILGGAGPSLIALTLNEFMHGDRTLWEIDLIAPHLKSLIISPVEGFEFPLRTTLLQQCAQLRKLHLDLNFSDSFLGEILRHLPSASLVEFKNSCTKDYNGPFILPNSRQVDSTLAIPQLANVKLVLLPKRILRYYAIFSTADELIVLDDELEGEGGQNPFFRLNYGALLFCNYISAFSIHAAYSRDCGVCCTASRKCCKQVYFNSASNSFSFSNSGSFSNALFVLPKKVLTKLLA